MTPTPPATAPPPAPPWWCLPLGLLLAGGAWLVLFHDYWAERQALDALNLACERHALEQLAAPQPEQLRVVALGHSLLTKGVLPAGELEALAAERGLALSWARIDRQGGGFGDWAPLIEPLLATRPDLILVDERLLVAPPRRHARRHLTRARAHLRRLLRYGPSARWPATLRTREVLRQLYLDEPLPPAAREHAQRAVARIWADPPRVGPFDPLAALGPHPQLPLAPLAAAAREQGARVVLLEVPLHPSSTHPTPPELGRLRAAELAAEHGLERWSCPLELPLADYAPDRAHLLPSGRAAYSAWLLGQLEREAAGR